MSDKPSNDEPTKLVSVAFTEYKPPIDKSPYSEILLRLCGLQASLDVLLSIHVCERFPEPGPRRDRYNADLKMKLTDAGANYVK